jgi:carboxyl-terminal processing protease
LISPQAMSSGEILAISFIGRDKVRLLGEPTRGLTTGNKAIPLSDGAELVLTTDVVANRHSKIYEGSIIPDEVVATDWERFGMDDDPVIMAALKWLATLSA